MRKFVAAVVMAASGLLFVTLVYLGSDNTRTPASLGDPPAVAMLATFGAGGAIFGRRIG